MAGVLAHGIASSTYQPTTWISADPYCAAGPEGAASTSVTSMGCGARVAPENPKTSKPKISKPSPITSPVQSQRSRVGPGYVGRSGTG